MIDGLDDWLARQKANEAASGTSQPSDVDRRAASPPSDVERRDTSQGPPKPPQLPADGGASMNDIEKADDAQVEDPSVRDFGGRPHVGLPESLDGQEE